jgi:hypothetical protein
MRLEIRLIVFRALFEVVDVLECSLRLALRGIGEIRGVHGLRVKIDG